MLLLLLLMELLLLLLLLHHVLRLLLLHMVLRNVLRRGLSKLLTIRCMRLRRRLRTPRGPRRRGITGPISSRAGHLTTPARGPHLLHTRLVLRTLMPRASHGT